MAALAVYPGKRIMPHLPVRGDEFGELGFTQTDRDDLKKAGWLLEDIRTKLQAFESRLVKVEDGRAHQKDLDKLRDDWQVNHAALVSQVQTLMLKLAAAGGVLSLLAFLEPVFIHFFWPTKP